jgi:phosphoglycerate dehydrogenase-like enzyme
MPVLYANRRRVPPEVEAANGGATFVSLHDLLARSDFVSIHVPLGPSTRRLIGAPELRRMKPTAILINTARGPVVDQAALYTALRDGVIGGAALDVTDPEPMPGDDPLLTLDNCLVVPHIASASRATRGRMAAMAAANLIAGVRSERLPNPVNPEIYEVRAESETAGARPAPGAKTS